MIVRDGHESSRFAFFFEMSSEPMAMLDLSGCLLRINAAFAKVLETSGICAYTRLSAFILDEERISFQQKWNVAAEGGQSVTASFRIKSAAGAVKRLEWRFTPDFQERVVYAIGRAADEPDNVPPVALLPADARYRFCLDQMLDCFAVFSADRDGAGNCVDFRFDYLNEMACEDLGLTMEEAAQTSFLQAFPGMNGKRWEDLLDASKPGRTLKLDRFHYKDERRNSYYDMLLYGFGDGFAVCWRNVTRQRETEERLAASNKKFSVVFHNASTINFILSARERRIIEANRHFMNLAQCEYPGAVNVPADKLDMWPQPELLRTAIDDVLRLGFVHCRELPFRKPDGGLGFGLLSGEQIAVGGEDCVLFILKDVTAAKETEKQLVLMDKYHLLGSMAASIAHEVRNPMTTVKGFLQLFMKGSDLTRYRSRFELMLNELERANSIITEYLTLAANKNTGMDVHDLNGIIAYIRPLLEADALKHRSELSIEYGRIGTMLANEKEIRQLLLNLSRNAIEAMPCGGTLAIRTSMKGTAVVLEVSDQGSGIDEALVGDIFKPFFTTKETGTGLGLAVCRSIAERHRGSIRVETGPSGTTFVVTFETDTP